MRVTTAADDERREGEPSFRPRSGRYPVATLRV